MYVSGKFPNAVLQLAHFSFYVYQILTSNSIFWFTTVQSKHDQSIVDTAQKFLFLPSLAL